MIEVVLETIQTSLVSTHRIIVLKEIDSERYLPIWIGPFEAEAISIAVNQVSMPRPLTHDLLVQLIDILGAKLEYIHINKLEDKLFHARLVLLRGDKVLEVDSRTSDAVAVAMRMNVPIYVADEVLDAAGVVPEAEISKVDSPNLGVFRNFLSQLDADVASQDN